MSGKDLDALAKGLAEERISRGGALKRMGAVLLGGLLASAPMTAAFAAPQTCVTCICGTGRPCNPKSNTCTVVRTGFSAEQSCEQACAKKGQNLCGQGTAFHCPHGCP
jgi:hypothetical protein